MFTSLKLKNLLSFQDVEIELKPLNILIGPNGVGKSNLIRVMQLVQLLASERDGQALAVKLKDYESLLSSSNESESSLLISGGDYGPYPRFLPQTAELSYNLSWRHGDGFNSVIKTESVDARYKGSDDTGELRLAVRGAAETRVARRLFGSSDSQISFAGTKLELFEDGHEQSSMAPSILSRVGTDQRPSELVDFIRDLSEISVYTTWDLSAGGPIKKPQSTRLRQDLLSPSASNLSLFFNHLQTKGDAAVLIEDWVKQVNPRIKRISPSVTGNLVQLFFSEKDLRDPIPSLNMSDGTMQFLALMGALFNPDPPTVVCIEEPESSLHPEAITILAQALREASERTQIIITTHSEALVDCFSDIPEYVMVAGRDSENGQTTFSRLDADELAVWLEKYSLGELWVSGESGGVSE
jgi:predicted ATPase